MKLRDDEQVEDKLKPKQSSSIHTCWLPGFTGLGELLKASTRSCMLPLPMIGLDDNGENQRLL